MAFDTIRPDSLTQGGAIAGGDKTLSRGNVVMEASMAALGAALFAALIAKTAQLKSTGNLALSGEQTIDGFLTSGSRVLLASQTAPAENGIYVTAAGAWSRAADFDTWAEAPGSLVSVQQGTVGADTVWLCTSDLGGTLGTTAIAFVQIFGVTLWQPANPNLSTIAALVPTTNNFIQAKSSAWASRTPAQVLADLGALGKFPFPATQIPSAGPNDFDDYEEGVAASPSLTFGGLSVGLTGTFTIGYTKKGDEVTIHVNYALTSKGTSTGVALITGLPFSLGSYIATGCPFVNVMTSGVGDSHLVARFASGTSVALYKIATGNVVQLTDADFTNTSSIYMSLTYKAA